VRLILFLIVRYHPFLVFLLLEVLCITQMRKDRLYHDSIFISGSSDLVGKFRTWETNITEYVELSRVNRELAVENAQLRNQLRTSLRIDSSQIQHHKDSGMQQYDFIAARLIRVSLHEKQNRFTIDQGALAGVRVDDAVIGTKGVVGKVVAVSPQFATVVPIINIDYRFPARLKRSNHIATMTWDGDDFNEGLLNDIPGYEKVHRGDTIVADYYSSFPSGFPVGVVTAVYKGGEEGNYQLKVKYFENLAKLSYVYVVRNLFKEELKQLEETSKPTVRE
jgi:rod shape-determining protein MreC